MTLRRPSARMNVQARPVQPHPHLHDVSYQQERRRSLRGCKRAGAFLPCARRRRIACGVDVAPCGWAGRRGTRRSGRSAPTARSHAPTVGSARAATRSGPSRLCAWLFATARYEGRPHPVPRPSVACGTPPRAPCAGSRAPVPSAAGQPRCRPAPTNHRHKGARALQRTTPGQRTPQSRLVTRAIPAAASAARQTAKLRELCTRHMYTHASACRTGAARRRTATSSGDSGAGSPGRSSSGSPAPGTAIRLATHIYSRVRTLWMGAWRSCARGPPRPTRPLEGL
jgi:hypothetical protein